MQIEFGNHAAINGIDDRPKVTTFNIPEADDSGKGGYTYKPGSLSVTDFALHRARANDMRNGITNLPDHEVLLNIVNAWPQHSTEAPAWVKVTTHEELSGTKGKNFHDRKAADDLDSFLRDFYQVSDKAEKPADVEDKYWTRNGAPGQFVDARPNATNLYTYAGQTMNNLNDGGGLVGVTGTGTAATATTLTVASNPGAYTGYRIYAMQTATGPLVWGNITSITGTGPYTINVDRWYTPGTPGGAAAAAPSAGYYYVIADGGPVSSWFVGLTTTNITPARADTALSGEYSVTAGGMYRKIASSSNTAGVANRTVTLSVTFTATGSDTLPSTFYALGVFGSIVPGSGLMKFESQLAVSGTPTPATVNGAGDNIQITETITGS